jgi:hypothetical protein
MTGFRPDPTSKHMGGIGQRKKPWKKKNRRRRWLFFGDEVDDEVRSMFGSEH